MVTITDSIHYQEVARMAKATEHKGAYTLTGIPPDLWRQVKSAAALEGKTLSEWILDALRKAVRR
jgi:predicted HicB family RNase H-like nuclease